MSRWVRFHRKDLPILWDNAGRVCNPDLVAVENDGTHLLIEVKSDRDVDSIDVAAKSQASVRTMDRWCVPRSGTRRSAVLGGVRRGGGATLAKAQR